MTSSAWHDRGLQRTNPVHALHEVLLDLDRAFARDWEGTAGLLAAALQAWSAEGVLLPPFAVQKAKKDAYLPTDFPVPTDGGRPGVLGLVVQGGTLGLVLPLACREAPEDWRIDETLPFRSGPVLDALVRLIEGAGLPTAGLLPERLAFAFENPLGHQAYGNSMTLAAALAILDELGGRRSDLLRCACAVIEPEGTGKLVGVQYIRPKLAAMLREHRRGSLLIAPAGCPDLDEFRPHFEDVWEVKDFIDLARRLANAHVLDPLLEKVPLRRVELERVHNRLHWLTRRAHDYAEAAELGRRLEDCAVAEPVPVSLWDSIRGLVAEVARHLGRFVEADQRGRQIHDAVQARGRFTSYDDQADAAAEYAAALFDLHDFARIPCLMRPWVEVIDKDPRQLRPLTRVKVLNTLGRGLVILGEDGWEACFRHSQELQAEVDPGNIPRTLSYLAHGLLRHNRLDDARRVLDGLSAVVGFSGWMLRFLRADLARRTGESPWTDSEMEKARPRQRWPGHPFAFYFQATARQQECVNPTERLQWAVDFLRADAGTHPHNICSLFASCVDLFAAATAGDEAWAKAAGAIRCFLEAPAAEPLRRYYQPALDRLGDVADGSVAEGFLRLIPYL